MINAFFRALAGIVLGSFVVFVGLIAVEGFSAVVHPFPKDFGGTTDEICRHVERYPGWVLAAVVPMWALAAFLGTWIARRVGNLYSAGIVGFLVAASLVLNISMLPYPAWFEVATLVTVPLAMLAGGRLAARRSSSGRSS